MVSFNDSGTEAEALSEQDDGSYSRRGRGPTKYTNCRYCGKSFPLREISAHARTAHYEESTKRTDCRKCGDSYPLREINLHARSCDGKPASNLSEADVARNLINAIAAELTPGRRDKDLVIAAREMREELESLRSALAAPVAVDKAKLAEFLTSPAHAPASTHSPADGTCSECPWPRFQLPPEDLARELSEWLGGGER